MEDKNMSEDVIIMDGDVANEFMNSNEGGISNMAKIGLIAFAGYGAVCAAKAIGKKIKPELSKAKTAIKNRKAKKQKPVDEEIVDVEAKDVTEE